MLTLISNNDTIETNLNENDHKHASNSEQVEYIKSHIANIYGDNARVYLSGSRVDDAAKGGDIDLYIESEKCRIR